jgi:hypothetical protein
MGRIAGTGRAWGALAVAALVMATLAGCVPETPMPTPEPTGSGDPSSTATEPPRNLDLGGTAGSNQPFFDDTNNALIAQGGALDGRAFIDNLVAAGFPKAAMEVTPDRTTVNAQTDQLQFSVRINGACLIGQYGGGEYNSSVGPQLTDGRCLIGTTRPIDW